MNNYIKTLVKGSVLSLLVLSATSCSDSFLQTSNPNEPSQQTFWQTEADALMGLTACYNAMQSQNLYDDNIDGWCFGFLARESSTDNGDKTWSGGWMLGENIARNVSSTTDDAFKFYWNANYEVIKCCNLLTANIDRCDMSDDLKDQYKAEAIAIRGLMYCNLISVYRDVPYLTEPLTLAEAQAPKTEKATIASSVIADLKTWVPKLAPIGQATTGHLTREAGYAILGRIALFTENWNEAISAYRNVIGKVSLFKSGDGSDYEANYADLFTEANENAPEILMSIHYKGPSLGEGQCFGVCWGGPMNAIEASMNLCDDYYCTDGLPIETSPLFKGTLAKGGHSKTNPDLARFENRDPRLKGTLFVYGMDWNGVTYLPDNGHTIPSFSTCAIRKWYVPENTANEYDGSLDYYVIRYPEVLLSLAEALVETNGSETEITSYVDEVRARVGMPPVAQVEGTGLSQAKLREIVRHERRVELAFEDLRFADLYRWGEWENGVKRMQHDAEWYDIVKNGADSRNDIRGAQDLVWPIPQSEIDTNPMLEQHSEWK